MRVHSLKTNVSEEKFPLLAGALNSGRDITVCPQALLLVLDGIFRS